MQYLIDHHIPYRLVEYMKVPLHETELRMILLKMNRKPWEIIRTHDPLYIKELKARQFTDDEWIKIILDNLSLLVRPIVVAKHKAVIAIPPDKIAGLL